MNSKVEEIKISSPSTRDQKVEILFNDKEQVKNQHKIKLIVDNKFIFKSFKEAFNYS